MCFLQFRLASSRTGTVHVRGKIVMAKIRASTQSSRVQKKSEYETLQNSCLIKAHIDM
jgi:hypothetical protein